MDTVTWDLHTAAEGGSGSNPRSSWRAKSREIDGFPGRALAVLLEQWRTQLAVASPAAVAPAQLVIALTSVFLLCDVRVVGTGPQRGIHIVGQASAAFYAALSFVYVHDRMCDSTVGEKTITALLTGFMVPAPDATQRGDLLH